MVLKYHRRHPRAKALTAATSGSAGLDLWTAEPFQLPSKSHYHEGRHANQLPQPVDTGLAVEIPDGFVGLVFERSSAYFKYQVGLLNKVGVIDSDYRGTIKLPLYNYIESDRPRNFDAPICVAQLVVVPVTLLIPNEVSGLSETGRGEGGFGSTSEQGKCHGYYY